MKKIICVTLFIICSFITKINAQNYVVGIPVDDTLIYTLSYGSFNCYPNYSFRLHFPFSEVTGVDHILIFINVIPANSVYTVPGDTVNTGDTLVFNQSQDYYDFYFPSTGSVYFFFKAIGIPQIANETYKCGDWGAVGSGVDCMENISCFSLDTCTVSGSTSFNIHIEKSEILFSPDPATNYININSHNSSSISICNLLGQEMYNEVVSSKSQVVRQINVTDFPTGIYFIKLKNENGSESVRKFVKE